MGERSALGNFQKSKREMMLTIMDTIQFYYHVSFGVKKFYYFFSHAHAHFNIHQRRVSVVVGVLLGVNVVYLRPNRGGGVRIRRAVRERPRTTR